MDILYNYTDYLTHPIRQGGGGRDVRHQETCPMCRRPRVNLYPHAGIYLCKQCIDRKETSNGTLSNQEDY